MHLRRARLLPRKRFQDRQRVVHATAEAMRGRQHQQRGRVLRNHAQDLDGLLPGQFGVAAEQARSVVQCDIETGGGFRQER